MKKILTLVALVVAFATAIFAAVQTELRMHVFHDGDNGTNKFTVAEVDSVKFTVDTLEFKVSFVDWDGEELQSGILQSGAPPKYEGEEPKREQTEKYVYDFKGWIPEIGEVQKDITYTAEYDTILKWKKDGALSRASYKVSDEKSVYFSQGNLQFNAAQGEHAVLDGAEAVAGTWRFAENQYDYVGKGNNENISETYDGWIDLFGWGTSGWSSGANAYQPWATSTSNSDYYPGGSYSNNLTGGYAKADWGVYNAISNGGDEPNRWRTLTAEEWQYLFKNNKWTLGYVKVGDDSRLCYMLIPEDFAEPEGTTVTVLSTSTTSNAMDVTVPSTNTYTTEQFASLEELGVVALPGGGYRDGTAMRGVGLYGNYWSSSAYGSLKTYLFCFYAANVISDYDYTRHYGRSVRLVQDL